MKKAKVIIGAGYIEFEKNLNDWLADNEETEIYHLSHSETDMTITNSAGQSLAINSFSALIVYEIPEIKKRGKITSRLPRIENIPPNELKEML